MKEVVELTIRLLPDGAVLVPPGEMEEVARWCREHKKGIAFACGDCGNEDFQCIYLMEHGTFMAQKLMSEVMQSQNTSGQLPVDPVEGMG